MYYLPNQLHSYIKWQPLFYLLRSTDIRKAFLSLPLPLELIFHRQKFCVPPLDSSNILCIISTFELSFPPLDSTGIWHSIGAWEMFVE